MCLPISSLDSLSQKVSGVQHLGPQKRIGLSIAQNRAALCFSSWCLPWKFQRATPSFDSHIPKYLR